MSITPRIAEMGPIVLSHLAKYPNLTYIGQEMDLLKLLLWGEKYRKFPVPNDVPVDASHPIIRDGKTKFWVDPWPWMDFLRRPGLRVRDADPRQHRRDPRGHAGLRVRARHADA